MSKSNELPEWSIPYTDNYTGPNWSDGKFQGSVSNGASKPLSQLDRLSQRHDAVYSPDGNVASRDAADMDYWEGTRKMSLMPRLIGDAVLFGNAVGRGSTKNVSVNSLIKTIPDIVSAANPYNLVKEAALNNFKRGANLQNNDLFRATKISQTESAVRNNKAGESKSFYDGVYGGIQNGLNSAFTKAKSQPNSTQKPTKKTALASIKEEPNNFYNKIFATRSNASAKAHNINTRLDRFHKIMYKNKRKKKTKIYCL